MIARILVSVALVLLSAASGYSVPTVGLEHGAVPQRDYRSTEDQCHLRYYNMCSGWVFSWNAYCYGHFEDAPFPPMYGTCFDLSECPGDCRHLEDVWWACRYLHYWGCADIEVYCADEDCCPVGSPLAGIYEYFPDIPAWQHLNFGGLPLCSCEESGSGKFIIMITQDIQGPWGIAFKPYSDVNSFNINAGCESECRCAGHSYVYRNLVSYCEAYGAPGALWATGPNYGCTNYPLVPPGCHNSYCDTGFFTEWLIDCYISCLGATATEEESWSKVKTLYR
jgi:hypothetical protein